ncbi:HesA/MoeB/ThiF family protein [Celeribacter indicus]|nr:HesA/MoeB/ThiF family protein [Celeribacter indicus]SDX02060.1 Molybdopterin or thiamine biosynthesis adenylyltransferase [Celeribacter indicus]
MNAPDRYARQTVLPEIGAEGQARLAAGRVLVVGAGGLGAHLLPLLAGAGVGHLRVVDPDVVEESNLHRQTLYRMSDLGQPKAAVAADSLAALNPECEVVPRVLRLDPLSARAEAAGMDLVIDAADSFAVTYALSDLCHATGTPLVSASVLARAGYAGGFCGGAPSVRAVFPDLPARAQNCATGGVMGPVVATLGALQAQMALAVLLGHAPSPLGQILTVDLASWRLGGFRFDTAPEPEAVAPEILSPAQIGTGDLVIDLREVPGPAPRPASGQRVVFVCSTGLRAWRAAQALRAQGHPRVAVIGDGG